MYSLDCFKAYDIRGIVPEQLNPLLAYKIGQAYAQILIGNKVVIGHDIRLSGPDICEALAQGLMDSGKDVIHIGQCGTEEIYFAVPHFNAAGGVCVTASHNPANYNGMKIVGKESVPVSEKTGLAQIKAIIEDNNFPAPVKEKGSLSFQNPRSAYTQKLLEFIDIDKLKPLKIVVNPGNGGAGEVVNALEKHLPFEFIKVNFEPDGHFPNGVPNPLLIENRAATQSAIKQHKADLGVAWDGDFDRCFFFDEKGDFIEGYYLVGLFAKMMLDKEPEGKVIFDPRLYWNTESIINDTNALGIKSKTGHAFIKERMREEHALYGGEMSAHHYFRDFYYCDNGTIPWLLICQFLSSIDTPLSSLVEHYQQQYPCSGEINLTVGNATTVLEALYTEYAHDAIETEHIDGLGVTFDTWRFNVRCSNTEPLLRVNVETRGDINLLNQKTSEIVNFIKSI